MSLGKYTTAVVAGVISSNVVYIFSSENRKFYEGPFAASLVVLVAGFIVTLRTLSENFGSDDDTHSTKDGSTNYSRQRSSRSRFFDGLVKAIHLLRTDVRVLLLAVVQTCFEGSLFLFVFIWTPALSANGNRSIPHGMIFGMFMICCMIGSFIFRLATTRYLRNPAAVEDIMGYVFASAFLSIGLAKWSDDVGIRLTSFCAFETAVGMYYPCVGTLRSRLVPNDVRGTMLNIFRIGLNLIVVCVIFSNAKREDHVSAVISVVLALLVVCVAANAVLFRVVGSHEKIERR